MTYNNGDNMNQTFDYQGHSVIISPQNSPKGIRYWFIIDGRPVTYTSNPDTAKRLAVRFIEVTNDAYYKKSRTNAPAVGKA